jgi:glycosyltransferase involved in cell wall biosynthesis
MTTITYITVTFNAAGVLQRTLDSVLQQDYPHIRHLIIDGASADATLQMTDDYRRRSNDAANGHEVLVTSEPDGGIYDAMNKGLRSATGDYVCFLNAGDFLPASDTVSRIVETLHGGSLSATPPSSSAPAPSSLTQLPAVLYGDTNIVDGDGRFLRHRRLSPPEHLSWRSFRYGMLVCHQAFYARVDFAMQTPFDLSYRFSADVDWCIRIMRQADSEQVPLLNLHRVVACYTEEGATTKNHKASLRERFLVMKRHYGLLQTLLMHGWFVVRAVVKR